MFDKLLKAIAPVAAIAIAGALAGSVSGCSGNISMNGAEGVPLAELDMAGDPPTGITLAAPVSVVLKTGTALKITANGDDDLIDRLRFANKDGMLMIGTDGEGWSSDSKTTLNVTMPSPQKITMAGSGTIDAQTIADEAAITIAGSGSVAVKQVASTKLDVTLAGSGSIEGGGTVETLDLTIAGSGGFEMESLKVENADVSVAGSGSAAFASDGTVDANIIGSGSVRVIGRADCTVSSMGSGTLKCEIPAKEAAKPKPAKQPKS